MLQLCTGEAVPATLLRTRIRGLNDVVADYLVQRFENALAVAEEKASASGSITPARLP